MHNGVNYVAAVGPEGGSLLHGCVSPLPYDSGAKGRLQSAKVILDFDAQKGFVMDMNAPDSEGRTPFHR